MIYLATVVTNSGDDKPLDGAIKVVCPSVWGFQPNANGNTINGMLRKGVVSPIWIYPVMGHSNDITIPDPGDNVLIEKVTEADLWVWRGVVIPEGSHNNPFIKNPSSGVYDLKMSGVDLNSEVEPEVGKNRVLGTKCGSAVVFKDTWREERDTSVKRASKGKIVVGGKSELYPDRKGIEIDIDATEEEEKLILLVQDKEGDTAQSITIDNKKDAGFIELLDRHGQHIVIDSENELITLEDKHGNVITMDEDGIKIESSKELNVETSDTINIKSGGDLNIDAGTNNVEVKAMEVSIDASSAIKLGGAGAIEEIVKGTTFKTQLEILLTQIKTHTHDVPQSPTGSQVALPSTGLAAAQNPAEGALSNLVTTS